MWRPGKKRFLATIIICGCHRWTSPKAGQSEISDPKPYRARNRKMLWGGRRGNGNFVAASNRWRCRDAPAERPRLSPGQALSRSHVALDQKSTIIAYGSGTDCIRPASTCISLSYRIETTAICVIDDILDCLSARRSPCVQDRETAQTEQRNHFRLERGFYRCADSRSSLSPWPD